MKYISQFLSNEPKVLNEIWTKGRLHGLPRLAAQHFECEIGTPEDLHGAIKGAV
jgi:hypothetical protein